MTQPDSSEGSRSPFYNGYILVLLLIINTLSYADRHVFSILIPDIKAEFGASDSVLGLLSGPAFIVSYVLLTLPLARLGDRWSRRGVVALAAGLWSIASAACGIVTHVAQMAVARVLVGVGEAGAMPSSQAIVAGLFSERKRSSAIGVLTAGTYTGLVVGLTGGAAIASQWDWRAAFIALSLPGLLLAVLIWLTGPRQARDGAGSASDGGGSLYQSVRLFLAIPSLRYIALGVGVYNVFGYAGATWLPAYFIRSHGMSVLETGTWLGLGAAAGGIAGSLAGGVLVDSLRKRNEAWQLRVPALGQLASFPLLAIMFLLPGGMHVSFAGLDVPAVALLLLATGFLSALWAAPAYGAVARLIPPAQRAQAAGVLIVIVNLVGSVLGPPAAGIASDLMSASFGEESMRYSLLALTVLVFAGGLLSWRASLSYTGDLARSGG
ncbi:MAG: MFS transporter [Novosphingobium sp.]|nr:MFS transporter [Novosphingobium sp.]